MRLMTQLLVDRVAILANGTTQGWQMNLEGMCGGRNSLILRCDFGSMCARLEAGRLQELNLDPLFYQQEPALPASSRNHIHIYICHHGAFENSCLRLGAPGLGGSGGIRDSLSHCHREQERFSGRDRHSTSLHRRRIVDTGALPTSPRHPKSFFTGSPRSIRNLQGRSRSRALEQRTKVMN